MRKKLFKLVFAGVAAAALPALALTAINNNSLQKAPAIGGGFETPPDSVNAANGMAIETKELRLPKRAQMAAPADGTPLPSIIASVYDYNTGSIGMYQLPEVSGDEMTKLSEVSSYYGGAYCDGVYYACHDGRYGDYWDTDSDPHGHKFQKYDPATWQPIGEEMYFATYRASDLAFNPSTGKAYAYCDYGSMMYHLYEIDFSTQTQTDLMGNYSQMPEESSRALAFDSEGRLWGVTKGSSYGTGPALGVIDMATGINDKKFPLAGVDAGDSQHGWTADVDPETGNFIFIYNASNQTTGNVEKAIIYSINLNNGEMTTLAEFPGKCITSMYIAPTKVADGAPGVPVNTSASFADGSLSGTVSFTMPSTLFDGTAASGTATWNVAIGKEVVATGTAAYGADVTANVTVSESGKTNFSIYATNAAGDGKKASLRTYIGPDTPLAPAAVNVVYTESTNTFEVSWDAVTEGVNGGYIDPSAVTYTVTRNPGSTVVAENTRALTLTDIYTPAGIENVSYSVVANHGALASQPAFSTPVTTGSLILPFSLTEEDGCLDDWTIIDANDDGSSWEYSTYNGVHYRYNSSNTADDWLITPPVKAKAGMKYHVTLSAACYSSYSGPEIERLEVKWGMSPIAGAMTNVVVEPTEINQGKDTPQTFEFDVVPDNDGKFFVGVHAISDPNKWYLFLRSFTIAEPVSNESPAAPAELTVTADRTGALKASGSVKAPAVTSEGAPLSSLDKIEIYRGTECVATIDKPATGTVVTFEDNSITEKGEYSYTAYAYSGTNKSAPSESVGIYAGINTPNSVTDITIAETATPGEILVTWEAPTTDWRGYPINGDLTYNIEVYPDNAYYHGNKTYTGITGNSYTLVPEFENGRDHGMVYVKVSAETSAGPGYSERSINIPVGQPLALPFKESFPNYTLQHPWGDGQTNGPQIASISDDERAMSFNQFNGWNRLMDQSFQSKYKSQDGDNGFAGMMGWSYASDNQGNYHDEWTELISPKVTLEGESSPMLTFYTFNWLNQNGKDNNRLEVDVICDGKRTNVFDKTIGDLGTTEGWEHVAIDLKDYAGKVINLIFKGTIIARNDMGYNWVLIDNINIGHVNAIDLGIDELTAPALAEPGADINLSARVTNYGRNDIESHKVTLYHNDSPIETKSLGKINVSSSEIVDFTTALTVTDPSANNYYIAVEAEGDENAANNTTETAVVARRLLLLPEPRNVTVLDGKTLKWDAPDTENALPAAFTDDFESYGDFINTGLFSTTAGDWVFVDVDGAEIGGIISSSTTQMIEFPGIPTHSAQSWWVQNRAFEEFNNDYYGYSGLQYLANMYVVNEAHNRAVPQDDWAISPELCGEEQTISLMARSYDRYHPETIELLYSTGSTAPADFKLVRRIDRLPGDWTEIVFAVPEGARRFAIRGCSFDEYNGTNQTFVDDVTFVPAEGERPELKLLGYNIYRDGTRFNSDVEPNLSIDLDDAAHVYAVSAVYATGESRAVIAGESAIGNISLNALDVKAGDRSIDIFGLNGETFTIYNPAGMAIANEPGRGDIKVSVDSGIYIVRIGSKVWKVAVR